MDPTTVGVEQRLRIRLLVGIITSNVVGAGVVGVLAAWIAPTPHLANTTDQVLFNLVLGVVYLIVACVVGATLGIRLFGRLRRWLIDGEALSPAEQVELVLRGPRRLAAGSGILWGAAVPIFGLVNLRITGQVALTVAVVVAFGGAVTCSITYLFAERFLREAAGIVLVSAEYDRELVQSVAARQMFTWIFSTGLPVLGLLALGIAVLAHAPHLADRLPRTVVALASTALAVGLLATSLSAKATADPIESLRKAMDQVRQGDLEVSVPVYDGTQVGLLQAGFNRMAEGLRERDRLADLFGRHVGVAVARQAQERGIELGGETREVSALFVDLQASTRLAGELAAQQVVDLLNRFFGVVVEVIEENGGFVNKFEGDAALAVFGAPAEDPYRYRSSLRAAVEMDRRLRAEVPEVSYGIGVAGGEAVAGNIGSVNRLEYTVIGDPVNEASRLTDLAKGLEGRVAASGVVVRGAAEEGESWVCHEKTVLRGRLSETEVFIPTGTSAGS